MYLESFLSKASPLGLSTLAAQLAWLPYGWGTSVGPLTVLVPWRFQDVLLVIFGCSSMIVKTVVCLESEDHFAHSIRYTDGFSDGMHQYCHSPSPLREAAEDVLQSLDSEHIGHACDSAFPHMCRWALKFSSHCLHEEF